MPLLGVPQGPCEKQALTLIAEAFRALSGVDLFSVGSSAKMPEPRAPIETACVSSERTSGKQKKNVGSHCTVRFACTTGITLRLLSGVSAVGRAK